MYTTEQKNKIDKWLKDIGAQTLGIDYEYEYAEGQLLEATEVYDSIYDYDRWIHLQRICEMEIPRKIADAVNYMLYRNDLDVIEMNSVEDGLKGGILNIL